MQVVIRDAAVADELRSEYCLKVVGEVAPRPEGNENPDLPTGDVEVLTTEIEILSTSDPLPFPIDEHVTVGEDARLRHRYLDLRREGPGRALRLRAAATKVIRSVMDDAAASSRSRRPTSPVRRPRARATSWCRCGCSRATGTRCRSLRSCSSSC